MKPAPPPTYVEAIIPAVPPVEVVQPPPTVEPPPVEPIIPPYPEDSAPVEAVVSPPQVEPVAPPAPVEEVPPVAPPAVDSPPPCELVPPPPEPVTAPSPAPELMFEEPYPPCHCVELAVVPADEPVSEPFIEPVAPPPSAPSPSDPSPAPEEFTPTLPLPPVVEDEVPAVASVPPPAAAALPISPEVVEEELRQKIKGEMQRSLEEEINLRRQELQRQLEEMRAQAQAEAKAAAQAQVDEQVKKTLEAEKAAHMEKLTDAIMKERMKTEDEKLMVQLYWMELKAYQLEEKEKELKKREVLYKKHVAKLETKCTEFYKGTAESFQKGKEETHNRFARVSIRPVCGDLQSQILKCYKENTGKTLSCSSIASAYMQCVDNAKKNKVSTGG
ncbi:MICOS complex subunit Mic25-like isoform X2 [Seriola dumerili]|nr:MICOS complex subunit Mic25-like isoform X2 [Seriola dumerili]